MLCFVFFILLLEKCFSQINHVDREMKIDTADFRWKSGFERAIYNPPSYFLDNDLKLLSYKLITDNEMTVEEFLTTPIDSMQLYPKLVIGDEMLEEMKKDNYDTQSEIYMVPFSEMSLKEQYMKIGLKVSLISELVYKDKPSGLVKLYWKYKKKEFYTYSVISGDQFIYDFILSDVFVYRSSRTRISY